MADAPIAFVCAMPLELKPLTKRLGLRRSALGGGPALTGTLEGRPVVAVVTGIGTRRAASAMRRLLGAVTPRHVLVVGIAGAVEDETPIGAVVLPARVVDHASGREHDHHLLGPGTVHGALWTTDVVTPASELPALRARGVVALDMETAAVALACEERHVPWTVFRAVSDRATDGSVDDELFHLSNRDGSPNPWALARYVLRHPGRVPGLARLARGATLAADRAADAAIAAVLAAL